MAEGQIVDDFTLANQDGDMVSLSDLVESGPVVVFFYPKAMTPGWTKESCHFRDLAAEFAELGASRVGISADPVDRQKEFSDLNSLDFPLLSDSDRSVHKMFGTKRPGKLPGKRATFVVDQDRRIVKEIRSETSMLVHADDALVALRELAANGTEN